MCPKIDSTLQCCHFESFIDSFRSDLLNFTYKFYFTEDIFTPPMGPSFQSGLMPLHSNLNMFNFEVYVVSL